MRNIQILYGLKVASARVPGKAAHTLWGQMLASPGHFLLTPAGWQYAILRLSWLVPRGFCQRGDLYRAVFEQIGDSQSGTHGSPRCP